MAFVDTTWYCNFGDGSTTGYYAVAKWAATHAYTVGNVVRQNAAPTLGNERVFVCYSAGTSLSSEPSWTLTRGAQTTETGGPKWQEVTGQPAFCGDATNVTVWTSIKSALVSLGQVVKDVAGTHAFICTTSGV